MGCKDTPIKQLERHKHLLKLAIPLILANVTTPLLGLVDTAILGHMGATHYLAGASIGAFIVTQLYWLCGFLKMSMTGISAQVSIQAPQAQLSKLLEGLWLAGAVSFLLLAGQSVFLHFGLWFLSENAETMQSAQAYFYTRIWSAPAALSNLVLVGWLIGQQKTSLVFILQLLINLINIACSLFFVYVLDAGVAGVAAGSVVAEYIGCILAIYFCFKHKLDHVKLFLMPNFANAKSLFALNSDIFLRNLILQLTLAFVTFKGTTYGVEAIAINAIMMHFFSLIALGLDGVAHAVEALVGRAKGRKNIVELNNAVSIGMVWSINFAIIYALTFLFVGDKIASLLTDQKTLIAGFADYQFILVLLPVIAFLCFLYDGIYVGLTAGKVMRNTMLLSALFGFFPAYFWFKGDLQNQALWVAILIFLAWRGILLLMHYRFHQQRYPNTHLFG